MPVWFDYYRMLTAHGVLMALVFTTFFITGLSTFATYRQVVRERRSLLLGWISYAVMLVGTVMAALTILSGNASVLYTFYAPLKASPWFYFGATILILGTWGVAADIIENVVWFKRRNPLDRIPLAAYMATTTFIMWFIATLGVVAEMYLLIPWSLGWTPGVDVELTRMLFWYFGHPLVYFWIMGAYLIWYTVVPATFGGRIFSDALTRLAFILLLLFSTPVGIHHQFVDPGISAGWKWLHMLLTYGVVIPSFMTAFAIFATFELAARRAGVHGFLNTIRFLTVARPDLCGSGARHAALHPRRLRGYHQHLVRHGRARSQYDVDRRAFSHHGRRTGRTDVHGRRVWPRSRVDRPQAFRSEGGARASVAVVHRHDRHVAVDALGRSLGFAASDLRRELSGRCGRLNHGTGRWSQRASAAPFSSSACSCLSTWRWERDFTTSRPMLRRRFDLPPWTKKRCRPRRSSIGSGAGAPLRSRSP